MVGVRLLILLIVAGVSGPTADAQELPRVLILGDSVYRQPATEIARTLKDRCEVVLAEVPPGQVFNSGWALENIDTLLGDGDWDLIHVNAGLGDLVCRAPAMKSFRILPHRAGGIRATSPQQYRENITQLISHLKATEARLVWATTTPIRSSATGVFEPGAEVEYNMIAADVMKQHGIPVNDMYRSVHDLIDMDRPAAHGQDPFSFDRKSIHEPIIGIIIRTLSLKPLDSAADNIK